MAASQRRILARTFTASLARCTVVSKSEDSAGHPANASETTAITQPGAVSTVPTMVRGDWVLFHPVYTPEELRAVEVREPFKLVLLWP